MKSLVNKIKKAEWEWFFGDIKLKIPLRSDIEEYLLNTIIYPDGVTVWDLANRSRDYIYDKAYKGAD